MGDYLEQGNYSRMFIDYYLVPMAAAVWSADLQLMYEFPARYLIRFFYNHGLLSVSNRPDWYVIKGGSKTYVEALTQGFKDKIRLASPVSKVERQEKGVLITSGHGEEHFDAVFIACHSDQALALLHNPTGWQEILGAINYQPNEVLLHTDSSVCPSASVHGQLGIFTY